MPRACQSAIKLVQAAAAFFAMTLLLSACDGGMRPDPMRAMVIGPRTGPTTITLTFSVELPGYGGNWIAEMDDCPKKPCTVIDSDMPVVPTKGSISSGGARTTVPSGSVGAYLPQYTIKITAPSIAGHIVPHILQSEVLAIAEERNIFATSANLFKRAAMRSFYTYYGNTSWTLVKIVLDVKDAPSFANAPTSCSATTGICNTIPIPLWNCRSSSLAPETNAATCDKNDLPTPAQIDKEMSYYALADKALALAE